MRNVFEFEFISHDTSVYGSLMHNILYYYIRILLYEVLSIVYIIYYYTSTTGNIYFDTYQHTQTSGNKFNVHTYYIKCSLLAHFVYTTVVILHQSQTWFFQKHFQVWDTYRLLNAGRLPTQLVLKYYIDFYRWHEKTPQCHFIKMYCILPLVSRSLGKTVEITLI